MQIALQLAAFHQQNRLKYAVFRAKRGGRLASLTAVPATLSGTRGIAARCAMHGEAPMVGGNTKYGCIIVIRCQDDKRQYYMYM
jgi:hypothetical protein